MCRLHPDDFQLIKDNVEIQDLIGGYVNLKKKGATYEASCPFHTEKTPSFKVFPQKNKQNYKCFGCGKSGDIFTFVEEMERSCKSPSDAARLIAARNAIPVRMLDQTSPDIKDDSQEVVLANEYALTVFREHFKTAKKPQWYLHGRGYTKNLVHKWEIGFAPSKYALDYNKESLMKAKLIKQDGSPVFKDRIIFPIRNHTGRLVGFAGRVYTQGRKPKYVNTTETLAYRKGEVLYGLHQNLKVIKKLKHAILFEGYTDVNLIARADCKNAVGFCGTSFTDEQAKLISKYVDYNYVLTDGDKAGDKALANIITKHWKHSIHIKPLQGPKGQDPASLALDYGVDMTDHLKVLCHVKVLWDSAEGQKDKKTDTCLGAIAHYPNGYEREKLIRLLAKVSGYNIHTLLGRINKYTRKLIYI